MQETFARVLSRPRVLQRDNELYYLMRVLRNTFLTGRRTASRRPMTVATLEDVVTEDPRPMGRPERALEVQELYATIAALPEDFRMAVVAIDVLGLSYREAAHALGVREATITTRLHRARKQLAGRLAPPSSTARPRSRTLRRMRPSRGSPPRMRPPRQGNKCGPEESFQVERPHDRQISIKRGRARRVRALDRREGAGVAAPRGAGDGGGPAEGAGVRAGSSARRFGLAPRLAAAGGLAAAVAALAIALLAGGGSSPTLSQGEAAAASLRPATQTGPRESPTHHMALAAAVDGVAFPYWEGDLGWRSVGARTDRIGARTLRTVFYADTHGHRIGYTIVAGSPAPRSSGGVVRWRRGMPYRLLVENGVPVVTWLRKGHMCVVSGRGVSSATLLRLASWSAHGSIAS